jgi:hypothetical protein
MKKILLPLLLLIAYAGYGQGYRTVGNTSLYKNSQPPFVELAKVKKGEPVTVLKKDNPTTYLVDYKGKEGYVAAGVLEEFDGWREYPERRDNQLLSISSESIGVAFKAIHRALMENNYRIENADGEAYYLTATAPWGNGGGLSAGEYRLNIFLKEENGQTNTYIQGTYAAGVNALLVGSQVNFSGQLEYQRGGIPGRIFENMEALGKSIPNASIRYRRKL